MEETRNNISRTYKKSRHEDSLKIPSLKSGGISLGDIIAATIGEDARSSDLDGEVQHDFSGDFGKCIASDMREDLNFSFYLNENSNPDIPTNSSHEPSKSCLQPTMNDHNSQSSDKFRTVPEIDNNSNTGDSSFKEESGQTLFPTNLNFESQFENHDDFLSSLVEPKCSGLVKKSEQKTPDRIDLKQTDLNLSNDSDLEDSMHFVDPDDLINNKKADSDHEVPEPRLKKRRLSDITPYSQINHRELNSSQNDLISLLYAETYAPTDMVNKSNVKNKAFPRRRSFSGVSGGHRLQRQTGASELGTPNVNNDNSHKTPTMFRTRSFSGACSSDRLTPISEGRPLDTSLSSLLGSPSENSQLSNNPFYEDLKCTLLSDLSTTATDDCPKTLFDTLCQGQKADVYARERNLHSRFSSLQAKYPDEVRDLSSFYRQQSAEVETERFREIHDERFPLSYRNHLNRYYDNLLHMIMERVEKSLLLLSKSKKETRKMNMIVNQGLRTRPLLSRKAVSMMEEWYTRNYEHPYPSQTAVEALAAAGQITPEQVKKWFANKRNRAKNTRPLTEVVSMKRKRQFSSRW